MPSKKFYVSMELQRRFLDHLRSKKGGYPVYSDLYLWMAHEPDLMQAQDLWKFKQVMGRESFFQEEHFRQVDAAYAFYLEDLVVAAVEDEAGKGKTDPS